MEKTLGRKPEQLETPEMPESLRYLWEWHEEMFSPEPLSFSEIEAWARLMRLPISPDEARAIKMLNRIFWRIHNEASNA